jgi:hypothetical protein
MKRFSTGFLITLSLAFQSLASAESAALPDAGVLSNVSGMILVNRGDGYAPLKSDRGVKKGDRIMARAGGRGRLLYTNGCTVGVQPGKVVTVGVAPNCDHYSADDKLYTAADLPEPHPAPPPPPPAFTPDPTGIGTWPIIVGGLVVVGAGVGIAVASQSSNSPASP